MSKSVVVSSTEYRKLKDYENLIKENGRLKKENQSLKETLERVDTIKTYLQEKVVLGLCFALPSLPCQIAHSVVEVMTMKELSEFAIAIDELDIDKIE